MDLSLIIVKGRKVIFKSSLQGLAGLIEAIEGLGEAAYYSSVADKIVGRAAALLLAYLRAKEVYAVTMSRSGLSALAKHHIRAEYEKLVPEIMNRRGDDLCPFEKITLSVELPEEAYIKIKHYIESLKI
ncbi:DUF1893 domain-containing protein [Candidatus Bathyarchaeota archaeon]|nr:DUF1893 domain-containing protein [Candidatus Bathyarchaeota archaeon]